MHVQRSIKYTKTCGCLSYIFHNSHNLQINLCTITSFIDIGSFIPYDEKVFLIPDFKKHVSSPRLTVTKTWRKIDTRTVNDKYIIFISPWVSCAFHHTIEIDTTFVFVLCIFIFMYIYICFKWKKNSCYLQLTNNNIPLHHQFLDSNRNHLTIKSMSKTTWF